MLENHGQLCDMHIVLMKESALNKKEMKETPWPLSEVYKTVWADIITNKIPVVYCMQCFQTFFIFVSLKNFKNFFILRTGCPQTGYVAQAGLELAILLPHPPKKLGL
jgi:hypothetical protein